MEKKRKTFGMLTRPYRSDDFEAVRKLYQKVWDKQRGMNYDRIRLRDTFDGLPVASVGMFNDDLGGFFTIWPMLLTDGKQIVSGGQAMDVMTDERFRGKGVFPALATQTAFDALARGIRILYGVPNKAIYDTYIKRLAWASPTKVRTCVRPLSLRGKHRALGTLNPVFAILPSASTSSFSVSYNKPQQDFVETCIAENVRSRGVWQVAKSPEWYQFRYQENEQFDYRWLFVTSETSGKAFAVWGIDNAADKGLRRANLLEIVGNTPASRAAAVAAAITAAKNAGAAYIAAITTSKQKARWLSRNGFFPIKSSPLIVKTLDPSAFNANPFKEDAWDLFGGDFDFV